MSTNVLLSKIFGCEWLFGGDARVEDRPRKPEKPEKNVPCDYWLKSMTESGVYVPNRDITDKYELNVRTSHCYLPLVTSSLSISNSLLVYDQSPLTHTCSHEHIQQYRNKMDTVQHLLSLFAEIRKLRSSMLPREWIRKR